MSENICNLIAPIKHRQTPGSLVFRSDSCIDHLSSQNRYSIHSLHEDLYSCSSAGNKHSRVCQDVGSDEVQQVWGDELWEDVPGHEVPLRLWEAGQEGAPRHGQGEASLLQVSDDWWTVFHFVSSFLNISSVPRQPKETIVFAPKQLFILKKLSHGSQTTKSAVTKVRYQENATILYPNRTCYYTFLFVYI